MQISCTHSFTLVGKLMNMYFILLKTFSAQNPVDIIENCRKVISNLFLIEFLGLLHSSMNHILFNINTKFQSQCDALFLNFQSIQASYNFTWLHFKHWSLISLLNYCHYHEYCDVVPIVSSVSKFTTNVSIKKTIIIYHLLCGALPMLQLI
jgi:hypothetical protein